MAKPAVNSQSLALPDNVFSMLAEADKQRGFPPGTMQSLLMQETSGNPKYIQDPTTYHYQPDASGNRKSTARGPFGILDSTAKSPGFGVAPLGDATNFAEHLRFAGDYLAARSKKAGSLSGGLAGYGEGPGYANSVMARMGLPVVSQVAAAPIVKQVAPPAAPPVAVAQVPMVSDRVVVPPVVADATVPAPVEASPVVVAQAPAPMQVDPWQSELTRLAAAQAPVQPADLAYGKSKVAATPLVQSPDFMAALSMMGQNAPSNFNPFHVFLGRKARA